MNIEQIISNFHTRYAHLASQAASGSVERRAYESYILRQSFDPVQGMPTEQKLPTIIASLEGFTRSDLDPECSS